LGGESPHGPSEPTLAQGLQIPRVTGAPFPRAGYPGRGAMWLEVFLGTSLLTLLGIYWVLHRGPNAD